LAAIAPDVVMLDHVDEENCALLPTKHNTVAAADPGLEIVLVRKDGLSR